MNGFAFAVGIGAALGLYRISRQQSGQWLEAALIVLALSLLGARLGYTLLNWGYFSGHPSEILQLWLGGLNDSGAVIGGLLGLAAVSLSRGVPIFRLADQLYPLLPPLTVGAWLGCWLSGSGYGTVLPEAIWWAVPSLDESGRMLGRLPVQLIASLCLLVFYWLLELLTPIPRPAGWLFSLAATWMVLVNLIATLLRADQVPLWGRLRADTWMNLFLVVFFLALFVWAQFKARHLSKGPSQPVP